MDETQQLLEEAAAKEEEFCHCFRCGWEGPEHLAVHANGTYCPQCPDFKDDHASLSNFLMSERGVPGTYQP
jgi:hypothetical protein